MRETVSFAERRRRMVDDQLRRRNIRDERVLTAMRIVPREQFLPETRRDAAYDDNAVAIGHGQTISQPYTAAFMAEAACLTGDERVLEVGTGSGYGAAVLSHLAREVYTIERIPELAAEARDRLARLGFDNVCVLSTPAPPVWSNLAPFDAIIVTAAAARFPRALAENLAPRGRLIVPIGEHGAGQIMHRFTRIADGLCDEELGEFTFVPLIDGAFAAESENAS